MDLLYRRNEIDLAQWRVQTNMDHRGIRDRIPAIFKSGSRVNNSLICHGCEIYGEVVNSILSPGVVVGRGTRVCNSIIMFDTKIGDEAFLNNVILDADITVAAGMKIGNATKLAANPNELQVFGEGEVIR